MDQRKARCIYLRCVDVYSHFDDDDDNDSDYDGDYG